MTDEQMLACATTFTLIEYNSRRRRPMGHISELKVEYRGDNRWAIVDSGHCLNHDGEWEHEPLPSNRDDDFFTRCRWPSAREAIAYAEEHVKRYPSGYIDS